MLSKNEADWIYHNYKKCFDDDVAVNLIRELLLPLIEDMPEEYPRGEKDFIDLMFNIFEVNIMFYTCKEDCGISINNHSKLFERGDEVLVRKDINLGLVDIECISNKYYTDESFIQIPLNEWMSRYSKYFILNYDKNNKPEKK